MSLLAQRAPLAAFAAACLTLGCATGARSLATAKAPPPAQRPSLSPAPSGPAPAELEREGLAALKANDRARARQLFERALALDGGLSVAPVDLGVLSQREGDLAAAARHYEVALDIDPDFDGALLNLGQVYRDRGELDRGIALYRRALQKRPFEPRFLNNLAVLLRLGRRYQEATEVARQLLARGSDPRGAYQHLALIAADEGRLPLSRLLAAAGRDVDPRDPAGWNNLGLVQARLGERQAAIASFQKALDLDAAYAPALANLGALALAYRDYPAAARSLEKLVALTPGDAEAFLHLGWAYEGARREDGGHLVREAAAAFEKALSLKGDLPEALHGLARACAGDLKDLPRAAQYYRLLLASAPGPLQRKAAAELAAVEQRLKAQGGEPEAKNPKAGAPGEGADGKDDGPKKP